MNIKIGIQIEPQFGFDYKTIEKIAIDAEKIGYYSLWSSDHFFLHDKSENLNCLDAWTLLSALAAVTKKLRLGVLVTCNSYRYPAILAKIASTIDMISEERLEFGIGAGWKEIEYKAYGIPFGTWKDRMDSLEEAIQIIKLLWIKPKASFEGKIHKIKDAFSSPKPVQLPMPPIFIGGTGKKRILNMVAKYADYCNFGWFTNPDEIQKLLDILEDHCKKENRNFDEIGKSFFAYVIMAETEDKLEQNLKNQAEKRSLTLDEYKKRFSDGVFIGTPEKVQERFQNLIDMGFDYFQCMFPYGNDYEASQEFGKLILPKLS
ncbi:MAG: Pyrimidine monooxygenase RutA [Candidatus Heimdallarchaeota archaeon LC_3]|nr:MAG: Pyrimidine monooxygenase RutA [Candidatus Heimdallarchaeota archaeon LC_3]